MRRGRYLAMALLLVLIAGGAVFVWRWEHRGPAPPSVSGAIGRFREQGKTGNGMRPLEPKGGVYLYDGTGRESLSFLSTSQSQGPTEPGTVLRERNGCWQFRIDFNSFHSQTWRRCATKGRLVESGGTTQQKFDFATFKIGEHSEVVCNPPFVVADLNARRGATAPVQCTGRSQTTKATFEQAGDAVFVGRETVLVEGRAVPGVHTREEMHLSGGQTGQVRVDIWFATADGLPLKEAHRIHVVSPAPAPLNHVTYTEQGGWQLRSLTPRT